MPTSLLISQAALPATSARKERSAGSAQQVHRTNRNNARAVRFYLVPDSELTEAQLKKRTKNRLYLERRKAREQAQVFAVMGES